MSANEILNQAILLRPQEKYLIIENLINSLNENDKNIEKLWIEETQRRLELFNKNQLETVSYEEIFS